MALFVIHCLDKAGGLDLRMATRQSHLDYLAGRADRVKLAGPYLAADGSPMGSMLLVEAEDQAEAQALADADPYALAGLFQSVEVRPFRLVIGGLA